MSVGWRLLFRRAPPWECCCIVHDLRYWKGGTAWQRFEADVSLMLCVAENGHRYWAFIMFVAVRLFGGPYWPHGARWGYGYTYPQGYDEEEDYAEEA
jgi:hypothetical protein